MIPISTLDATRFGALIDDLRGARKDAQTVFEGWWMGRDPEYFDKENASWQIEKAFLKLLVATEALGFCQISGLRPSAGPDLGVTNRDHRFRAAQSFAVKARKSACSPEI